MLCYRNGSQSPELPCDVVFETEEWQAAYITAYRQPPPKTPPDDTVVSTFGGFLNRKGDGEAGVQTLWIGLQRVRDFALAIQIHEGLDLKQRCG